MSDKPECFVIAPIGEEQSEIRKRSDLVLDYIIRPVAVEFGYNAVRADQISEPGSITTQVLNRILNAPMVVADLTGSNANVFYELAVRHASRKPYIQIIQKGEKPPFDVGGLRTIEIDHNSIPGGDAAIRDLRLQMEFAKSGRATVDNPISVAVDLASLSQSGDPEKRHLAEVLQGLAEVKNLIINVMQHLPRSPQSLPRTIRTIPVNQWPGKGAGAGVVQWIDGVAGKGPPGAFQNVKTGMPPGASQSVKTDMPPGASQSVKRDMPPGASQSVKREPSDGSGTDGPKDRHQED
jgi:hypothetical protein